MSLISHRIRKGFTLLELIVVIVILGILAAIAIPTFSAVINKSKDASAATTLRSLDRNVRALSALDRAARSTITSADVETAIKETTLSGATGAATPSTGATVAAETELAAGDYSKVAYALNATGYGVALRSQSGACLMLVNQSGTTTLFKSTAGACKGNVAAAGKQATDTDVSAASTGPAAAPVAAGPLQTFDALSAGRGGSIQTWTVPSTGAYAISATGAKGGASYLVDTGNGQPTSTQNPGGQAAALSGTFTLNKNDVIQVMVGQAGTIAPAAYEAAGGGGGGTFVYNQTTNTLLMAAGGGGGAGGYAGYAGINASTTTSGNAGSYITTPSSNAGGANGSAGTSQYGSAGAGWVNNSSTSNSYTGAALSFRNGGTGAIPSSGFNGGAGGYGGGGAGVYGAGGGGGYSGGGAGTWNFSGSGGGGGSFNGGTDTTQSVVAPAGAGHGTFSVSAK